MAEGIPFGKYNLVKRLARGGMAEVFLAHQSGPEGFRRRVAVKRILPHLADADEFVRMFLDEAQLAAQLGHPNVAHTYEFGKVDDYYFIAMEYVDGVDAGTITKNCRVEASPPELVARILADAASGLHHAHNLSDAHGQPLGIVHRDVSPPNLLVSFDGVVKVVDFGIAKAAYQAERTRPGVVKGKYAYMSPEQVVGKNLDGRSDVFSLALVGWEMLAGRHAVPREDATIAMRLIRDGKIPALTTMRPDVPAELAAAITRGLEKDVERRPTAAELSMMLESYLKGASRLATTMAVSTWLRERFPREATGPALALPAGTVAGTAAGTSAGTAAGTSAGTAAGTSAGTAATPAPELGAFEARSTTPLPLPAPERTAEIEIGGRSGRAPTHLDVDGGIGGGLPDPLTTARRPARASRRPWVFAGVALVGAALGLLLVTAGDVGGGCGGGAGGAGGGDKLAASPAGARAPQPVTAPLAVPIVAADAGTASAEATAPAASSQPEIEILTDPPGAAITVDGFTLDAATPAKMELNPGTHSLRITLEGHQPVERSVTLARGDKRTIEMALTPLPGSKPEKKPKAEARPRVRARASTGWLTVRTLPYSDVYLGGRKLGTTPLADLELPAGTHTLIFKNPDKGTKKRRVVIKPGATTKLQVKL